MQRIIVTLFVLLTLAGTSRAEKCPPLEVVCELVQSNRLTGTPSIHTLLVRTPYARIEVALANIRKLTLDKNHESVKVETVNGDSISGVLDLESFKLRTLIGDLTITGDQLVSMTVRPRPLEGVDQGLISYFDFEDDFAADRAFRNRAGNSFTVRPRGGDVGQQPGVHGKAVALRNAALEADSNPTAGSEHLSVALWFKTASPATNYKLASAAWWRGGCNASGWVLGTHYPEAWADDGKCDCRGGCPVDFVRHFKPGEWNHVAITYDREFFREFINGKLVFECASPGQVIGRGDKLVIGGWMSGFSFDGLIDELRIYNRALASNEVAALNAMNELQ